MEVELLTDDARKVLRVLADRPTSDGYSVMSLTKLAPDKLIDAIIILRRANLVEVKGPLEPEGIRDVFLWLRRMSSNQLGAYL
jgi:hypothetical protein